MLASTLLENGDSISSENSPRGIARVYRQSDEELEEEMKRKER